MNDTLGVLHCALTFVRAAFRMTNGLCATWKKQKWPAGAAPSFFPSVSPRLRGAKVLFLKPADESRRIIQRIHDVSIFPVGRHECSARLFCSCCSSLLW